MKIKLNANVLILLILLEYLAMVVPPETTISQMVYGKK
ncbi:hypothetical protein BAOM_0765 [Peribacillus asahii]|uniref:Uncharacterized protein n=1 Tax=Peribacillus asahii TaxID=228899 RepID=A0A3T0KM51_9BACI|nr:hypothetical protein BAOM_0765 [Peribacillus asahii]